MKGKKVVRIVSAILLLSVGMVLFFFLDYLVDVGENPDPVSKVQGMEKDLYNGYGLEAGQVLSNTRIYENERVVCYVDRLFQHFNYSNTGYMNLSNQLTELKRRCPSLEGIYVLPIPLRVLIEEGYPEDKQKYSEYLQLLSQSLPKGTQLIDVLPSLEEHRDEYVFYRTEDSWTARGAYYGSAELCKALGLDPFSLESYNEHMYNSFLGVLYQSNIKIYEDGGWSGGKAEEIPVDRIYYYLLPGSQNQEELFRIQGETVTTRKRPAISQSASGLSAFTGGSYSWVVVSGDGKCDETKDKSLLMVCDNRGKLLAPFMANYYKNVYVVNISIYGNFAEDITKILQEYNITDFVLAQSPLYMGERAYSSAMNGFMNTEQ